MEIIEPDGEPMGAVLVIHSWWGLTPSFRHYGRALAQMGVVAGLTDLFGGQTAETESEARRLRAEPRRVPMYKTLGDDIRTLRDRAGGGQWPIGVVGFSMGGHWAVWLSQRPEYAISATILYYAARAGDFSNCRAAIIAHFAETDDWVSAAVRARMERAIRKAECRYQAYDYHGTSHWFAEEARAAEYRKGAAELAQQRDMAHLRHHLGGAGAEPR